MLEEKKKEIIVYLAFEMFTNNFAHMHLDADNTEYIQMVIGIYRHAKTAKLLTIHSYLYFFLTLHCL